jgi:cytochrome P450
MQRPGHVPDELVVDYDVFGGGSIDEALAQAEQWRAEKGGIVWSDRYGGHWIVLSAKGIRQGLTDPAVFDSASRGVKLLYIEGREPMVPIELDGPEHAGIRKVLNPLFAPARMRLIDDAARQLCRQFLDSIVGAPSCDVVSDYARPLASAMFLSLVDWPQEDRLQLERLVDRELNGIPGAPESESIAAQVEAINEISAYCRQQLDLRRGDQRDDMTSTLMNATVDGQAIPENRLVAMLLLLMVAGLDTTQSVFSRTIEWLGQDPARQEALRAEPERIPLLIEEMLRMHAPAGPFRAARQDTELAGISMKAGDRLYFMVQAGNRDAQEFDDPFVIDPDREVNRHMAFGLGPHKCIGAAMARVVLNAALDEFHRRLPPYRLVSSASHLGGVWGMLSVRVEFEPAPAMR